MQSEVSFGFIYLKFRIRYPVAIPSMVVQTSAELLIDLYHCPLKSIEFYSQFHWVDFCSVIVLGIREKLHIHFCCRSILMIMIVQLCFPKHRSMNGDHDEYLCGRINVVNRIGSSIHEPETGLDLNLPAGVSTFSGGSRISHWGAPTRWGGRQPPKRTLFGKNICENKRN